MSRFYFFILFFLILFSCASKKEFSIENGHNIPNEEKIDLQLEMEREVVFSTDTNSRNFSLYPFYYYDDEQKEEYYFNRNEFINGIDVYNFNNGNMIKRLTFPKEGPNSIVELSGFFVKSLDSIFIFDRNSNKALLFDFEGTFIDQYFFPMEYARSIATTILSKFFVKGNYLVINYTAYERTENSGGTPTAVLYDIVRKKLIKLIPPLKPQELADNNYAGHQVNQKVNQAHGYGTVTRFGPLPYIYYYDYLKDEMNLYQLKSNLQTDKIKPMGKELDSDKQYLEEAYLQVIYDPYRHLYYSFYYPDIPEKNINNEINDLEDMKMSVIISDTLFNYRGETNLNNNKYFRTPFVTKEGLMIPSTNPKYTGEEENRIKYELFTVSQLLN